MNSRSVMKLVLVGTMILGAGLIVSCRPKAQESGETPATATTNQAPATARPQDANRLFNRALNAYNGTEGAPDRTNAFKFFKQAADLNHRESQARLGWMYLQGDGVDKDLEKAVKYLKKSADGGFAKAQNDMGVLSQRGIGMTNHFGEAVVWYGSAAKGELSVAQQNLAMMYLSGNGVIRNNDKAVEWLRKAAEHGHGRAQVALGNLAVEGGGMKQDYTEAFQWFLKAAEQSDPGAQSIVGTMYHEGIGASNNVVEAAKWLQKAAGLGNGQAAEELASMYLAGEGVERDLAATAKWLKVAAAQNYAPAQFELGLLYSHGLGVAKNPDEAIHCFRQALGQGHDLARLYVYQYERERLQRSLNMDQVVLGTGEIVSGRVLGESETNIQVEVVNNTRTIFTVRSFTKAEVKSIQRETEDHREQRPLCEDLLKYKLSMDQEYTAKVYTDAVTRLTGFLKRYPHSEFAPGLQSILAAWQYETAQLSKGQVKFAGIWMTPDEKRPLLAARDKQVEVQRQATPQRKPKKPSETLELLQSLQGKWIENCVRLAGLSGARDADNQPVDTSKLQQSLAELQTRIAACQHELGIQAGDEILFGRKNRTIGYGNVEAVTAAILAGANGEATWVGNNPPGSVEPIRVMPVNVRSVGPFGPLVNPLGSY